MIDIRTVELVNPNQDLNFLQGENKKLVNSNTILFLIITVVAIGIFIYNQKSQEEL